MTISKENTIEHKIIKSLLSHLSLAIKETERSNDRREEYQSESTPANKMTSYYDVMLEAFPDDIEFADLLKLLEKHDGNLSNILK